MREVYKPIKNFEGLYSVSNFGNVKREKTDSKPGAGNYARVEYVLSQRKNNKGYFLVDLYKNNVRHQLLVHRLVADAFIENTKHFKIVNHKDENKNNNRVNNLEWCTQKYNMNYGTCALRIGMANSRSIIQIDKMGNKIKVFGSIISVERETGISNGSIGDCLHGRRKTAGGYLWEYAI